MRMVTYMSPGFPESLFERLAEQIGADVHFERTASGPGPDENPFGPGGFDLGWVCSTSYVDLALRGADPKVGLAGVAWVPDDPGAHRRPVYFGDVMVRRESPIRDLSDLRGARIGCNDPVSLSGHHALRIALAESGHDPDSFADIVFTGGHHHSLEQVLHRRAEAAVVDSVVRIARSRHDPAVADLRVVARLGPWPVQPLVARTGLDHAQLAAVRRRLLESARQPAIARELEQAALTGLVEVGSDHYEPVRRAMTSSV